MHKRPYTALIATLLGVLAFVALTGEPGAQTDTAGSAIDAGDAGEGETEITTTDEVIDSASLEPVPTISDLGITFGIGNTPTPAEEAILEGLEEDYEIYKQAALEYHKLINNILKVEYEKRKILVEKDYSELISEEERLEDEARLSAIEYFEKFVQKYPHNKEYSPDAIFRLSELYYEQSYVDYDKAMDAHNELEAEYLEKLQQFEDGKISVEPTIAEQPVRDFSKSIELYTRLLDEFPEYRNIDGAYYLLGYCYNEMGEFDAAVYAWLGLVCNNDEPYFPGKGLSGFEDEEEDEHPSESVTAIDSSGESEVVDIFAKSEGQDRYTKCEPVTEGTRFYTETWLRIGEYHFDFDYSTSGLANAISAYTKAVMDDESDFYDLALYKLAWSHWRDNNYPTAIEYFKQVVAYSDQKAAETGKSGSELRPEAVQYIAFSFWEADWDGDMVDDPDSGLARLKNPKYIDQDLPWLSEVYLSLGSTYLDDNQNSMAIATYKAYLENPDWANALEAPEVIKKIIEAYDKEQNEQAKIEMIAKLSEYGPESEWAKINKDHPQTVMAVSSAAQEALIATAFKHHETAQSYKSMAQTKTDPQEAAQWYADAQDQYMLAAGSYREFLDLYPNTPDSYEMSYNLAEALFWSGKYQDAADQYMAVRDSQLDNQFQRDAAEMLIQSYLMLKESDESLDIRSEPPEVAVGPDGTPGVPQYPVPGILDKLIDAQQDYLKLFPNDTDNAPAFAFLAAETNFNYGQWPEAKAQYEKIYDIYCYNDIIAVYAWNNLTFMAAKLEDISESERLALLQKDKQCTPVEIPDDKKEEWASAISGASEKAAAIIIAKEAKDIMDLFFKAKELKEQGQNDPVMWEQAAGGLLKLYERESEGKEADKLLWNAVIAYEEANRAQSALKAVTMLVENHPESEFMGDALFKLAFNAFNAFDYEKSLTQFQILADENRFKKHPDRDKAIQNTANILENQQKYTQAAKYWVKYANFTKDPAKVMEAHWRAANCHYKAENWTNVEKEMKNFYSKFSSSKDPETLKRVVWARWYVALSFKERKKNGDFKKALPSVVEAYGKYVAKEEAGNIDPKATDYAAEAKFIIIDANISELEKFKLHVDKPVDKIMKELEDLKKLVEKLTADYVTVKDLASKDWTVAALFRIGYCYDIQAKIIIEAPIPKSLEKLPDEIKWDAIDQYQSKINQLVWPIEDQAKVAYENAFKFSNAVGVMNNWTEQTLERLNSYDPDTYPLYKKGKVEHIDFTFSMPPMDLTAPVAETPAGVE